MRMTRRDVLRTSGGLLATPALAHAASCAQAFAPWRTSDGLRLAGPAQGVATLDPALVRDLPTHHLVRQIFRGLMSFDHTLQPIPDLAERLDVRDGGARYRATLRSGIAFHDGRPIDAAAVRASLVRALRPSIAGGDAQALSAPPFLGDIVGAQDVLQGTSQDLSGVTVADNRTIDFALEGPSATFPMRLASVAASIVDTTETEVPSWWMTANGSGPFVLVSVDPAARLELRPFAGWWAGAPATGIVQFAVGPAASQPANLFQSGQIDILAGVPPAIAALVADKAAGAAVGGSSSIPLFAVSFIALGSASLPLDDRHLRRAISLAFPWAAVAHGTHNGQVIAATGLIPDGMLGRSWPVDFGAPDLPAAREELRASRYGRAGDVPPITIYAADIEPVEVLRDVVGELLGLRIDAVQVVWPDFLDGLAQRRFPAYALYWGADYPDPESLLRMLFGSESNDNYTGYRNPAFDDAVADATRALDFAARANRYDDAHRILIDDGAVIPLYFDVGHTFWRPGIEGVQPTPMGLLGLETVRGVSSR